MFDLQVSLSLIHTGKKVRENWRQLSIIEPRQKKTPLTFHHIGSLGIQSPSENGFVEPKCLAFRI